MPQPRFRPTPDDDEDLTSDDSSAIVSIVFGLKDVARGAHVLVPTTIYMISGDSRSGIAGLLYPDGTFLAKASRTVGKVFSFYDEEDHVMVEAEVMWDGHAGPIENHKRISDTAALLREYPTKSVLYSDLSNRSSWESRSKAA